VKIALQSALIAAVFTIVGLAIGDYADLKEEVRYVKAEQVRYRPVEKQRESQQQRAAAKANDVADSNARQGAHEPPETFVIPWLDKSIKVSDAALVVLTFAIAAFTGGLLWEEFHKSRKELRAYVALDDMYFRWIANPSDPQDRSNIVPRRSMQRPPRPRIRIKNFGDTPAHDVMVRINGFLYEGVILEDILQAATLPVPIVYEGRDYPAPRQMLAPTQKYGVWVHLQGDMQFDPHAFYSPDLMALVVHGAIIYMDIYERWWVTRFCYVYDGENRFLPHSDYNGEQQYESRQQAVESLPYE
jgi:hypothetical protein